ncbi:PREDICTED: uncharacterized protein LOC109241433 [Nicotiana attenuata]|uniref:uncharacterized protein LOC109241433 n=1 Tax=Nicotiana attenuata TaxID=49451 RepID=UPI000905BAB2|nr:PREDICTED: uncharacterized protein LOC109241433 [Nicotiana attenuata]
MSRFVRIKTSDLIPAERMPFPEEWNMKRKYIPNDDTCLSAFPVLPRSDLRDTVAMRPPPPGEEEIPKPTKEKKRKRASPAVPPKPKKNKARKPRADPVARSAEAVQHLRGDEEEGEDDDCLLVARKRGSTEALKAAEPVVADAVQSRIKEISERSSSRVPEPWGGNRAPRLGGHSADEPEGPNSGALQKEDNVPSESLGIINVDESQPGPVFSEGKFRDVHAMKTPDKGTTHEGNDIFWECFAGVVVLHRQAFSKSRAELARCEAELKKLVEERDNLKRLYVQKEEEVRDLRVELAKAHQEQIELIEHAKQIGEVVEQLREELKVKEAETLGWKQHMDRLASEKYTLRAQLTSIERQLQNEKGESLARSQKIEELEAKSAVEIAKVKSEAEAFVASYRADAEAANIRAQEISIAAEVKLSCALDHARKQSRRETLEEVHARGFDLSPDIKKAKILDDEAAALLYDDEDSTSGSER